MITKRVLVTQQIAVTVDETKFTPEFMDEFRAFIFQADTIDDHCKHLAQLLARGVIYGNGSERVEGYGRLGDMGISFRVIEQYQEMVA